MPQNDRRAMKMQDRPYAGMEWPAHPTGLDVAAIHSREGLEAVRRAHGDEIAQIAQSLADRQSVLVLGPKTLLPYLVECLSEQDPLSGTRWEHVAVNAPGSGPADRRSSVVGGMMQRLSQALSTAAPADTPTVVVVPHLDLMSWTAADQPRGELNEVVFWLAEYRDAVKLAFWDPVFSVPRVVEDLFPNTVSLQNYRREVLWKLLSAREARWVSPDPAKFTLASQLTLYQFVSGTNVVDLRRVLRDLADEDFPQCEGVDDADKVLREIHRRISPGAVRPTVEEGRVAGYEALRDQLEREVLMPFQWRYDPNITEKELRQAELLIPRGVILYGPPGTGKTEWAKVLAARLGATLFVIHGPELKHRLVGETEAAIRRIFAQARRAAPSLILIDEVDSITPSREAQASNFEASMVAQLLAEMDGLRKDETVLVVGTTNRLRAVDCAFLRPGRFGVPIEVGYPAQPDRLMILHYYCRSFEMALSDASLEWIAKATGEPLAPPKTGEEPRRFSGDHLRAILLYLLRESVYRRRRNTRETTDVNDRAFLGEALGAVRRRAGVVLPAPAPADAFRGGGPKCEGERF